MGGFRSGGSGFRGDATGTTKPSTEKAPPKLSADQQISHMLGVVASVQAEVTAAINESRALFALLGGQRHASAETARVIGARLETIDRGLKALEPTG